MKYSLRKMATNNRIRVSVIAWGLLRESAGSLTSYTCLSVSSYRNVIFLCIMLSGLQDRQVLVSPWAYSGQSSLAHWKGCKRKMDKTLLSQGATSTSSVLQLQCPEAEATACTEHYSKWCTPRQHWASLLHTIRWVEVLKPALQSWH